MIGRYRCGRCVAAALAVAAVLTAGGAAAQGEDRNGIAAGTAIRRLASSGSLGAVASGDIGSLPSVARIVGADRAWTAGATGRGVDVALIDTGVSPVSGLTGGRVVDGPDLSFDSQRPGLRRLDAHGHGTHLASIVAGIAPDARVVDLKVGAADGAVDVSQVIAAINWVSENGRRHGLNVRVLVLAFGTDGDQNALNDPLSHAVEVAWRKGVVVVVAAGNDGTTKQDLANPAQNPSVVAVGASDSNGTLDTSDDTLAPFSDRGSNKRYVDVVAPGVHVLGLRVPGGMVDQAYPASRVGTRYTRGSGTSQAAAVVSGTAALLLSAHPGLVPNEVKGALRATASLPPSGSPKRLGAGIVDVGRALRAIAVSGAASLAVPDQRFGRGTGSLEAARGTARVTDVGAGDGGRLVGERDIFGQPWDGKAWSAAALRGTTWSGGRWNGSTWTGTTWSADGTWATSSWSGLSWSGRSWTGDAWVGRNWAGDTWAGGTWTGRNWAGRNWATSLWSSATWS
jgi:serine protease AprX